ncbi:MAG: hemerythrin domain-containing protein [Hyphomicrobiaceae bacterium]|nr:hemerythrin domain-containing protein [Hyphomicrobiaceae bacterium]MCC0010222.1 hemerythrin domain-containing protein [Hyphomicrobiaceae bacterium]
MRRAVAGLQAPMTAMREDHDDHTGEVAIIKKLTDNLTQPDGGRATWTRLYFGLNDFITDLDEHIRVGNDVLFSAV